MVHHANHINRIRILLADDHAILREGVASILNSQEDMQVIAHAGTGRRAVECYREFRPDVVLIDIAMPDLDGPEAITLIREFDPKVKAIVLTTFIGEEDVYRSLSAGAKGYLLKGEEPSVMLACIRKVVEGGRHIPSEVTDKFMDRVPDDSLSARELDVLKLLVEGKSNQEAATVLSISESTIKFHVNHILAKLNAADRTQAVIIALRRGLVRLT
jgi:two-component system NarL family response regulator